MCSYGKRKKDFFTNRAIEEWISLPDLFILSNLLILSYLLNLFLSSNIALYAATIGGFLRKPPLHA